MVHQPFDTWLLNDDLLTPEQDRELRLHLRNCLECTALARANLSLRSAPVISPPAGFALRFQARMAAQRKTQRLRSMIGLSLLAVVGMGSMLWLLFPYLPYLALPPARLASVWIDNLIYLALSVRVLATLGSTILNVLVSLVPAYAWALSLALLGGMGFLWVVSFRRIGKVVAPSAA